MTAEALQVAAGTLDQPWHRGSRFYRLAALVVVLSFVLAAAALVFRPASADVALTVFGSASATALLGAGGANVLERTAKSQDAFRRTLEAARAAPDPEGAP